MSDDTPMTHASAPTAKAETRRTEQLLRIDDVVAKIGMSKACVFRAAKEGVFPHQRRIGANSVWPESEIETWIAGLPHAPHQNRTVSDLI
ncbi:MAG: helix-turn-helix transcriptional regulator [Geminicoccaceae bacterium]